MPFFKKNNLGVILLLWNTLRFILWVTICYLNKQLMYTWERKLSSCSFYSWSVKAQHLGHLSTELGKAVPSWDIAGVISQGEESTNSIQESLFLIPFPVPIAHKKFTRLFLCQSNKAYLILQYKGNFKKYKYLHRDLGDIVIRFI